MPIYSDNYLRQDQRSYDGKPMVAREAHNPDLDPSQDPLWNRIDAFDLDGLDATLPFTQRLARDNGWTPDYAARVVEEYKRFCYLALRAGHAVVPSHQIDQTWLLHLSYSRDYWDVFCATVLCADLHHSPARIGETEDAEHRREAYAETIDSYLRLSGERPPADIWPGAELLLNEVESMRRVNTADYLILRRPPKGLLWVTQVALIFTTLYFLWQKDFVIALVVGMAAAGIAIFRDRTDNKWITKPWRDGDDDGTSSGGGSIRGI